MIGWHRHAWLVAALALLGCDDSPGARGGQDAADAAPPAEDARVADAASPPVDAAPTPVDAAPTPVDAAPPPDAADATPPPPPPDRLGPDPCRPGSDLVVSIGPWFERFEVADGEAEAGPTEVAAARFRDPAPDDGVGDDWQQLYVDADAADAGDGSPERPLPTLAAALARADTEPTVIHLGPGNHPGPVLARGPLALVGAGPDLTRLYPTECGPVIASTGLPRLVVSHVHVAGGTRAVSAVGVDTVIVRQARLEQARDAALHVEDVVAAGVFDSALRGAGAVHVRALDSALAVARTLIGPGEGRGVFAGPVDPTLCDEARHAFCPHAGLTWLEETRVTGVADFGLDVDHGVFHLQRAAIDDVRAVEAPETSVAGVRGRMSRAFVTGGTRGSTGSRSTARAAPTPPPSWSSPAPASPPSATAARWSASSSSPA